MKRLSAIPAAICAALTFGCASPGPRAAEGAGLPQPGMDVTSALALVHAAAADETYRIEAEPPFVSRIEDGVWREFDPAAGDAADGAEVHVAIVTRRSCSDWRFLTEEEWIRHDADSRASWFLFRDDGLVAWDHWTFGPHCSLENHFRPAGSHDRDTERALLRFAAQRFPDPAPSVEVRFARGHAYLDADRLKDAQKMLRSGDRALDSWVASWEHHELAAEDRAALDEHEKQMRRARADLSVAIESVVREQEGPPSDPTERYLRGIDP